MTIQDTLARLSVAENDEVAFLVAATINLYTENLRRRAGRTIFSPQDVKNLHQILDLLLNVDLKPTYVPAQRAKVTDAEIDTILKPLQNGRSAIDELNRVAEGFMAEEPIRG